ncbi:MAG TPA: hypothetical protein VMD30_02005 [Tepidisphaeraceae bacterium]|nr:hypothetical protein [Tepidisphaeraceae bacterium]
MIKTAIRLVFLVLLLAGWSLAALSLHVIRTPGRFVVIPKERLGITDTYVDARKWTLGDLANHPDLVKRLLETNKADQFKYLTGDDADGQLRNLLPAEKKDANFSPDALLEMPVDF